MCQSGRVAVVRDRGQGGDWEGWQGAGHVHHICGLSFFVVPARLTGVYAGVLFVCIAALWVVQVCSPAR